ncbi:dihydroorotase [Candidatus Omnitrophota bacterium]
MKILIKEGLLVDPVNHIEEISDILINGDKISNVAKSIAVDADTIINAKDKIVMPGIVDMHVHLREPGREDKETVESGTKAASKGGVTTVLAMPNTLPAIDHVGNLRLLKDIIKKKATVDVFIAGAITVGRLGKKLCNIAALKKNGVIAISDDGSSVDSEDIMLEAFRVAKKEKMLVMCHCEDKSLSNKGVVNLGLASTRLGLRGISAESEYKRVERDIELAEKTAAAVHITHVSCKESVQIIAKAKKKGIKITADTAPHYFALTEDELVNYNTNLKVSPPLRTKEDLEGIKDGLRKGVIDAIASDHAPHTENEKCIEFEYAESGSIGLETELAVSITELVNTGLLGWGDLVKKISSNPARILGIQKGTLGPGREADVVIVSPKKQWVVRKKDFLSKSSNSAFLGRKLTGAVEYAISKGKIVYQYKP